MQRNPLTPRHATARPRGLRHGSARTTLVWLAAAFACVFAWASSFTVSEGEVAVVERFGDPRRLIEEPGLHFKWPAPIDTVKTIDMRSHLLDPPVEEFLTEDLKNVELDAFVAWRVREPLVYLTRLRDRLGADDRIGSVLQATLLEVLNRGPFTDLASSEPDRVRTLDDVRREVTETVAANCDENGYGIEIIMVGIERISFPEINKAAVERSMEVKRQESAAQYIADGNESAAEIETKARFAADELIATAKGDAIEIRGASVAAVKEIEAKSMALDEDLYWRIQKAEIAESVLQGSTLILPSDHPLTRVFDLVAPGGPPQKSTKPGDGDGEGH